MSYEFRLPNIVGNDKEQLQALKSYLYQFIPQLQWALNTINTTQASGGVVASQPQVRPTQTTTSIDPEAVFESLKPLIIKSAEIVEAYYDAISTELDGLYVAVSDFGVFAEQTNLKIDANSRGITQSYEDMQVIQSNAFSAVELLGGTLEDVQTNLGGQVQGLGGKVEGLSGEIGTLGNTLDEKIGGVNDSIDGLKDEVGKDIDGLKKGVENAATYIVETKASIKTGRIAEENGIPIYGIEVGQTNEVNGVETFNKYARFTSSRLSFYDRNDTEVAYISDSKLYIRNAEITESFQLGGYKDIVDAKTGRIITKWVGGS